jgi:coproporphyrinogen III oxidase
LIVEPNLLMQQSKRGHIRQDPPEVSIWSVFLFFFQKRLAVLNFGPFNQCMDRMQRVTSWLKNLQSTIVQALEKEDGAVRFGTESWDRPGGGGGITRLGRNGAVIEKGGVNFSAVSGTTPPPIMESFQTTAEAFFATGVSIVIHPKNPFVPIIHMNVRYFELSDGQAWFGGGIDLTPAYVFQEDAVFFHTALKRVCDPFDPTWYPKFKKQADSYFFIRHRQEARGIGGIFYDRLPAKEDTQFDQLWSFTQAVGNCFAPTYIELVQRRKSSPFDESHSFWQAHRRSRYVEFNLVYDAGTRFGLETNGRTESILMSLPPVARWESNYQPLEETPEFQSQTFFSNPHDWV